MHAHFQLQMILVYMRIWTLYSTHCFYILIYLGVQCNIIDSECHKKDNGREMEIQTAAFDSEPSELTDEHESTEDELDKLETEDEQFGQDTGSECEDNVDKGYAQFATMYTSHFPLDITYLV